MKYLASDARVSACKQFRYTLERRWGGRNRPAHEDTVLWCALNPSVADTNLDDPTVRKVCEFSRRWGFAAMMLVNMFAFRATKPKDLVKAKDPIGPENDDIVSQALMDHDNVILCWGAQPLARQRLPWLAGTLTLLGRRTQCLGVTQDGSPLHPLMQPYKNKRQDWNFTI